LGSETTPSTAKIHTDTNQHGQLAVPLDRRSSGQKSLFASSTNGGPATDGKSSSTMLNAIIRKRQESATQRTGKQNPG